MHKISMSWFSFFFLEMHFILLPVSAEHIVTFACVPQSYVQTGETVNCLLCCENSDPRVSGISITEHWSYFETYVHGPNWTPNVHVWKPNQCLVLHHTGMITALLGFPLCHATSCCSASPSLVWLLPWSLRLLDYWCSLTHISIFCVLFSKIHRMQSAAFV